MTRLFNPVVSSPCPNCPFRRDVTPFLALGRAEGILDSLATDHSFPCRQTAEGQAMMEEAKALDSVLDSLHALETAKAALDLIQELEE